MKKILSIAGAIALAASLFVACSSEAADDGRNSYIDNYTLDAVDITVKAYPGYNYVSWGVAKKGGTVKVLRDDGFDVSAVATGNFYVDTKVQKDVTYKYTAYTVAAGTEVHSANDNVKGTNATNTSNEYKTYWTVSGNSKSASAKAIGLDHYNSKGELTTALDLTGCTNAGDKKYVISENNLIFKKLTNEVGEDHIYVSFPVKGYLTYQVYFYKGNSFDTYYAGLNSSDKNTGAYPVTTIDRNFYKMDATSNKDVSVTALTTTGLGAGTWKAVVKVAAPGTNYVDSYVFAKETVTIDAVDATGRSTSIVNDTDSVATTAAVTYKNGYIDSGKTIRIVWIPAKNANNKEWATTNYKVYVADGVNKNAANYTALTGEIKADKQLDETVYYTEYAVTDNTAPYTFWVVLNDNGKLESNVPSVTVAKYADKPQVNFRKNDTTPDTVSAAFADKDNDGVSNDAVLEIAIPSNTGVNKAALITVKSVKYKVLAPNDNTYYTSEKILLDSEVKEVAAHPTADYTKYEAIVKDVAIDNSVVFLYTLQQTGKADLINVVKTTNKSNGVSTIVANEFYYVDSDESATERYKFKFTVIPGGRGVAGEPANFDAKENYTYKLFYAKVVDDASIASITSWDEISLSFAWKTDLTLAANGVDGSAWAAVAEKDVSSLFEDLYKTTLDASGKKEKNGKGAAIVFKYVKTSKAGVSSVQYSTIENCNKN